MVDLNELSPRALAAAMRSGTHQWGTSGGISGHALYFELRPKKRGRQPKCHCGCNGPKTHTGKANGVALTSGCELYIRRWVKKGGRL